MTLSTEKNRPWLASYPPNVDWNFEPVRRSVYDIFEKPALAQPDKPCIDFLNRKFTYGEIHDLVCRFACGLRQAGVGKGDKVGLCLPNTPYYVIAYFAAQKLGAIVVNFNVLYTREEIQTQINDAEVVIMVTLDLKDIYKKVAAALKTTTLEKVVICPLANMLPTSKKYLLKYLSFHRIAHVRQDSSHLHFKDMIECGADCETAAVDPMQDVALFQYTGGTTGVPKAAMLTHSNVASNTEQVALWTRASGRITDDEKFLAVLPFFHVFSMTVMMCMGLHFGAELVLLPRFKLKQAIKAIREKKITVMAGVPAIFHAINEYHALDTDDLASLSVCISGGAALPATVKDTFVANTSCRMVEGYGLSESSPVLTCNPPHTIGINGSIGLPLPGTDIEIRAMDGSGEVMPEGEKGELVAKGPQVMKGYWKQEAESANVLLAGGWLRTGDIAYMDDAGYVFLTDRLKDIIIVNGYKVYPRIIEDALYQHKAVDEVIVLGVPDKAKGEVPKAFVKLKDDTDVSPEELLNFISDKLNPIECPKSLDIRDELPKTLIGKPSRKALAEEEAAKRSD